MISNHNFIDLIEKKKCFINLCKFYIEVSSLSELTLIIVWNNLILYVEVFEHKSVNSILDIVGVNSLKLGASISQ